MPQSVGISDDERRWATTMVVDELAQASNRDTEAVFFHMIQVSLLPIVAPNLPSGSTVCAKWIDESGGMS